VSSVPRSLTRFLVEAGFLVLVAIAAGLAQLNAPTIVLLVGAVWGAMALVEWLAGRGVEPVKPSPPATPPETQWSPAPARPPRDSNGFEPRRRTWEWGSVGSLPEEPRARHVRVLPSEEAAAEDEDVAGEREREAAAEVVEMPSEPEPRPAGEAEAEEAEVPRPEPVPAPMPAPEPPAPPEPAPEPHRPPTPEPSPLPTPEPHEPRTPEPSPPTPIHQPLSPPPAPVPEPPPAAAREPEPVAEQEPEPEGVVPLVPRASVGPRQWNLWELERGARELAGRDPAGDEERAFLILYLRQFANADGVLPAEFDTVVRESFADVIALGQQG
jgi:hypothetical protein